MTQTEREADVSSTEPGRRRGASYTRLQWHASRSAPITPDTSSSNTSSRCCRRPVTTSSTTAPTRPSPSTTPAFCAAAGRSVRDGIADVGIVVGGSGQGEQLAANKVRGVRAALCNDLYTAQLGASHNDANVMSIGARVVGVGLAEEILAVFLSTPFDGGRHARRVAQLTELEEHF